MPQQGSIAPQYDTIVVGAGISGLYAARQLLREKPHQTLAIAERYKGLGGRTYSYSPPDEPDILWEMGAGRIHTSHTIVLDLLREYGLHWVPIPSEQWFQASPGAEPIQNPFDSVGIPIYIDPLRSLAPYVLATHTLEQLLVKLYGEMTTRTLLYMYPYRAEVNTLRADLALRAFGPGGEMSSNDGYGIVKEGFSALVKCLEEEVVRRGGVILRRHRLTDLKAVDGSSATDLTFAFGRKEVGDEPYGTILLRAAKRVILALHKDAVAELTPFRSWPVLRCLQTKPLLRIYAIFPTEKGASWFSGVAKLVFPSRPRYFIPIDASKGVCMISYTDADDTRAYMNILDRGGDRALCLAVMKDVRKWFPDVEIPDPIFFRSHPWETGCTYWTPGTYQPEAMSHISIHPFPEKFPGVWMCGESWCLKQAWVEGALEQTKIMLKRCNV